MEGTRYIEVPADKLLGLFGEIGGKVTDAGGQLHEGVEGREVVIDLYPAGSRAAVRVYTSLARGAGAVRGCGEDAVRLVVGYQGKDKSGKPRFWPLQKGPRIYRTAPTKLPEDERVALFLERLKGAVRKSYGMARDWRRCQACGAPMSTRENRQTKSKFWGCTAYPDCRATAPWTPSDETS